MQHEIIQLTVSKIDIKLLFLSNVLDIFARFISTSSTPFHFLVLNNNDRKYYLLKIVLDNLLNEYTHLAFE